MVEKTRRFFDLLPHWVRRTDQDPGQVLRALADALQIVHERQREEARTIPTLLSPEEVSAAAIVQGTPGAGEDDALVMLGSMSFLNSTSTATVFFTSELPVPPTFFDGLTVLVEVADAGTAVPKQNTLLTKVLATFGGANPGITLADPFELEQPFTGAISVILSFGFPNQVYLPDEAKPYDGYYNKMWVVATGPEYTNEVEAQIISYDGDTRLATLDRNLDPAIVPSSTVTLKVVPYRIKLTYLARMLGIVLPEFLPTYRKRLLIENATRLFKLKGTKEGYELFGRLLGFEVHIEELSQTYAREEWKAPPINIKEKRVDIHNPIFPYNSVGWGDEFADHTLAHPKRPKHTQFPILEVNPNDLVGEDPGGTVRVTSFVTDPANIDKKYPDSDISLYLQPKLPEVADSNLVTLLTVAEVLDSLRPAHVEVKDIGWLTDDTSFITVEEPSVTFHVELQSITNTIGVHDNAPLVSTETPLPSQESSGVLDFLVITRSIQWDLTQDRWDSSATWDNNVVYYGGG